VEPPILIETPHHGTDELPGVTVPVSALGGQPHAQGAGETFEVFDPGFVKAVCGQLHARGGS
jgi:hypothetical protein